MNNVAHHPNGLIEWTKLIISVPKTEKVSAMHKTALDGGRTNKRKVK